MAKTLTTKQAKKLIKDLNFRIPRKVARTLSRKIITDAYQRGLRESINRRHLKWTEDLSRLKVEPKGKESYVIKAPAYGVFLDSMKTHWVSLYKETPAKASLIKWAEEKFETRPRAIQVKGHPWIQAGIRYGDRKAAKIIRNSDKIINKELP